VLTSLIMSKSTIWKTVFLENLLLQIYELFKIYKNI